MGEENANILKRKMRTVGRDEGPLERIASLPDLAATHAVSAFTNYYGEKCQLSATAPAAFGELTEALGPHANTAAIYHFKLNGDDDFVVVLDLDAAMIAAGWSLAGAREKPEPMPESVSAIDRRLAKSVATTVAEAIFANAAACGMITGSIELFASGADPRRFEFKEETQRSVSFSLDAQTIEGEALGAVTIITPETTLVSMREYYQTAVAAAERKWKHDLARLVADMPVQLRATMAEADLDISRLMTLEAGEFISLNNATIDDVVLRSDLPSESELEISGALGNRDGARALKITRIDY